MHIVDGVLSPTPRKLSTWGSKPKPAEISDADPTTVMQCVDLHFLGHYAFRDKWKPIDLDAILTEINWA
jgi:hypothetical protein